MTPSFPVEPLPDDNTNEQSFEETLDEARGFVINEPDVLEQRASTRKPQPPPPTPPEEPIMPPPASSQQHSAPVPAHEPARLADWDPDEALAALEMEQTVNSHEDEVELSNRIFRENLPVAAQSIAHMAVHSTSERIRLDAARYVVERNLGKVTELGEADDPRSWEKMLASVIKHTSD